jgi:hypothetical protein
MRSTWNVLSRSLLLSAALAATPALTITLVSSDVAADTAPTFKPSVIALRLTEVFVRRTGNRVFSADLYVICEAFVNDAKTAVPQPQLVFKMPATDNDQVQTLGMNGAGSNMYHYDVSLAPSQAPPRNVHLRVRVMKDAGSLRKAAEVLSTVAGALGKAVPAVSAAGPEAVISASIAELGAQVVSNVLAGLAQDEEIYEWAADLDASDPDELGAPGDRPWRTDAYYGPNPGKSAAMLGSNVIGDDKVRPPPVRLEGIIKVK